MESSVVSKGVSKAFSVFFEYDTPKIVHINSKKVGVINRLIQLCIIGYVIGYAIVWKKGYQEFDAVVSGVTTKVKGIDFVNVPGIPSRVFDVADYVIPPQENDAFFVMTNLEITPGQSQRTCAEDPGMDGVNCTLSKDVCKKGVVVPNGNGVMTGECVKVNASRYHEAHYDNQKVCEISAWCPTEVDELPLKGRAVLQNSGKFTVLIKNNILFPLFNTKRRNILETSNQTFLRSCRFDKDDRDLQYCPIFELEKIVEYAGENYTELSYKGGVIVITINWDCNLDLDISECKPAYSFRRLDNKNAKISAGYNFRFASYYKDNETDYRDLTKAYGIRFLISVTGEAGKFNLVPLLTNVGSGLALLSIATVMSDIVVLYVLKKRHFYQEKKYQNVVAEDAYQATVMCDIVVLYILKKGPFYKEKKYLFVEGDDAYQSDKAGASQYGSTDNIDKGGAEQPQREPSSQKDGYKRMIEDD